MKRGRPKKHQKEMEIISGYVPKELAQIIRKEAKRILKEGKVKYVIGYENSQNGLMPKPAFIKDPDDVDRLIWDSTCVHNLAKFLVDEKKRKAGEKKPDERPVGIVVKGCDSRAIVVLLQEKYIDREDVHILGISCERDGVIDEKKLATKLKDKTAQGIELDDKENFVIAIPGGTVKVQAEEILAERCLECPANYPVVYDLLLGDKTKKKVDEPFKSLEKLESLEPPWFNGNPGTEDRYFCFKAREAGFRVTVDFSTFAGHMTGQRSLGVWDFMAHFRYVAELEALNERNEKAQG